LIKGYSDTHARGLSKFDRVLSAVPMLAARDDAGEWMDRLISAALKDEDGATLDGALETLKSL
jgi:indolepyruvate ferredoxin oxidoreductase, beta subunit